ncbi:MAG: glycosyltransferase family 2 protein [Candidatus Margulisiibacteriota bacterium]|jgi:glycosyltransferase involved in cell wall biosynthesis
MEKITNPQIYIKGLISVIIPVYNAEKYLQKNVKSVIDQTYSNWELIFINDGSQDNSAQICDQYAALDQRITLLHQKNSGPAAARNEGIKKAQGEFIFFLDADDFLEKDALKILIAGYQETKADIVIGNFQKVNQDAIEERRDFVLTSNQLFDKKDLIQCARNYLNKPNKYLLFAFSWGRLFKADIIKSQRVFFDTTLHTFEDVAFNFDYLNYADKAYFINKLIYNHLINNNFASATMTISDNPQKLFGFRKALRSISSFLGNTLTKTSVNQEVGHAEIYLSIIQLVRACGQINCENRPVIFKVIQELLHDSDFQNSLKYYSPKKGDSIILPLLMRFKLVGAIIWICQYKAQKRYKKGVK